MSRLKIEMSSAEEGYTMRELLTSTKEFGRTLTSVPIVYIEKVLLLPKSKRVRFVTATPSSDGGEYRQLVEFHDVELQRTKDASHKVLVKTQSGKDGYIKKLSQDHIVSVRCACQDYRFTWARANSYVGSFAGRDFPPVVVQGLRKPRNPDNIPGVCKHLLGVFRQLKTDGYIR
jgi:hypothetical protein